MLIKSPARDRFLQEAENYVGYTAPAGQPDMFSVAIGRPGVLWNGAFIDYIFLKTGVLSSCSYLLTNVALAEAIRSNRVHLRPRPGDVVFIETSTDPSQMPFNQPHVGIVTDVSAWDTHGMFQCIEGQTASGMPKGTQLRNGVFKRNRYKYEVLAFTRPNFKRAINELAEAASDPDPGKLPTKPVVKSSILRPGVKHKSIPVIQLALTQVNGLKSHNRGEWDHKTIASFANFQRTIGYIGTAASGTPDGNSLRRLGEITNLFDVVE
jgi:hypothetical protein